MIDLYFTRHGHHKKISQDLWVLTDEGIEESKIIATKLLASCINASLPLVYYCTPTYQAIQSGRVIKETLPNTLIKPLTKCDYLPSTNDIEFHEGLRKSIEISVFKYLVEDSEKIAPNSKNVSNRVYSYDLLSNIFDKYKRISSKSLVRIFCMKEHIYSCYRAHQILIEKGDQAFRDYVEWYTEEVENKDSVRTDVNKISISSQTTTIKDGFSKYLN